MAKAKSSLFVGLMSGTSMDAVDAVLAEFSPTDPAKVLRWHSHAIPENLRRQLAGLAIPGGDNIDLLGKSDHQLGELFADAVSTLLTASEVPHTAISGIGSHGQTIRHRPASEQHPHAFTLQIGDPNIIAARTGITTVADFRRADMAVGGQGAPLAPAFHQYAFQHEGKNRAIVNVGGMANVTWLPAHGEALGFDTGPGNRLMDYWIDRHLNRPFDNAGSWAASHTPIPSLLKTLLKHPFFSKLPPKSTGREAFNEQWLNQVLATADQNLSAGDVQATLLALTANSITTSITMLPGTTDEIYICGGGASNEALMRSIQAALAPIPVASTANLGVDPHQVEALAFAWFAQRTLLNLPSNLPAVTGASREAVLGGIYPGRLSKI